MTSITGTPPTNYFSNVDFNPSFWKSSTSSSSSINLAQTDKRYLQKTSADSATALEWLRKS